MEGVALQMPNDDELHSALGEVVLPRNALINWLMHKVEDVMTFFS